MKTALSRTKNILLCLENLQVEAIRLNCHGVDDIYENILSIVGIIGPSFRKIFIKLDSCHEFVMNDLHFLWTLDRVIPQIDDSVWNGNTELYDIIVEMINFNDDGTIPIIIQDTSHRNKGLVYGNKESIRKTIQNRILYRYSREHNEVMMKGTSSGNTQHVQSISLDCDNDTLLITVDTKKDLCHIKDKYSCFDQRHEDKSNINSTIDHIKHRFDNEESKYLTKLKNNPGIAALKVWEEYWEFLSATNNEEKIHEAADIMFHFLTLMFGSNVSWKDVALELNARRHTLNFKQILDNKMQRKDHFAIGVTCKKYTDKTDSFLENTLGIKLIRGEGKNLSLNYEIIDEHKYERYIEPLVSKLFGEHSEKKIIFIGLRPKDMPYNLGIGFIDACITYNSVMDNHPKVGSPVCIEETPELKMCIIKRKDVVIDTSGWGKTFKPKIACEHSISVDKYMRNKLGMNDEMYSVVRCLGSSESLIVNDPQSFILADALVETGSTLKENNLEIWQTINDNIHIGLYTNNIN